MRQTRGDNSSLSALLLWVSGSDVRAVFSTIYSIQHGFKFDAFVVSSALVFRNSLFVVFSLILMSGRP